MKNNKFDVQVDKTHYTENYDTLERFISYYYQIDLARKLAPEKVLEVGVGNKLVSRYLKQTGIKVETCDFDAALEPDHIGDVRRLPMKDASYDTVIACQVLEHLPWEEIDKVLSELGRVSKKYILIFLPYLSINLEAVIKFPLIRSIFRKSYWNPFFRIPRFYKKIEQPGEHYWEMGAKGFPKRKVEKKLKEHFDIVKRVRPVLNSYHYFFILKKR